MQAAIPSEHLSNVLSNLETINSNKSAVKYSDSVKSVGIVGCGWLGSALANTLLELGCAVHVTTRSPENQFKLHKMGLNCEILNLALSEGEQGKAELDNIVNSIADAEVFKQQQLVICVTPQFKLGKTHYAKRVQCIIAAAQKQVDLGGQLKRIILTSTTGVYKNLTGQITEDSILDLSDEKVSALVNAEQHLDNFSRKTAIVRLAGLVGPKRHPGRFLAGKTELANPTGKINLIHQYDAVGLLLNILFDSSKEGVFNGVSSTNAMRKDFYEQAAASLNLVMPKFTLGKSEPLNKNISNIKASQRLGYQFTYPDLSKSFEIYP